jgi:hypothetical protein
VRAAGATLRARACLRIVIGAVRSAVALVLAGGALFPLAAQAAPVTRPLTATVTACHADPVQANRYATFSASMNALPQSKTMEERFELQQNAQGWHDVSPAPPGAFSAWQSSAAGVTVLNDVQTVSALAAPASYRVIVHYRWLGQHNRTLRSATRTTPACRMPDERPNLVVGAVLTTLNGYSVRVRNDGQTEAGPFQVTLGVGSDQLPAQTIQQLGPHTATTVSFTGPACAAGDTLTVVLDPQHAVDETTRADDTKSVPC